MLTGCDVVMMLSECIAVIKTSLVRTYKAQDLVSADWGFVVLWSCVPAGPHVQVSFQLAEKDWPGAGGGWNIAAVR